MTWTSNISKKIYNNNADVDDDDNDNDNNKCQVKCI